jgi:hypothetical protein
MSLQDGPPTQEQLMPAKRYKVTLTHDERQDLLALVSKGKTAVYKLTNSRGPAFCSKRIKVLAGPRGPMSTFARPFTSDARRLSVRVRPASKLAWRPRSSANPAHDRAISSSMGKKKPILSPWLVLNRRRAEPVGLYTCWPTTWSSCSILRRFRTKRFVSI